MRREFANEVGRVLGIRRTDLIEKDIILHQLLLDLSKNKFFSGNFLFKGGTCLIKHHLGYYRFSEDIDFTWRRQEIFSGLSGKETRRQLSEALDEVGGVFEEISRSRDLDFKIKKGDARYVELVGSNRTFTFKIWYQSEIQDRESFIKVQGNFVEDLRFPSKRGEIKSLLYGSEAGEIKLLFPKLYEEYASHPVFRVYDAREILCEKARAILTRKGIKARDFVDIYFLLKEGKADLRENEEEIVKKIEFMLRLYKRFRNNFSAKVELLDSKEFFRWGEEKDRLLSEVDEEDFYGFVDELQEFLKRIAAKISFEE